MKVRIMLSYPFVGKLLGIILPLILITGLKNLELMNVTYVTKLKH
jgi:hypothetical protein